MPKNKERRDKRIMVSEGNVYSLPENLVEFKDYISSRVAEIPAEFLDKATMEFSIFDYGSYANAEFEISYTRPETDEEIEERVKRERKRKKDIENRELCEFERLKKKYKL